jgi:hypothetical protein
MVYSKGFLLLLAVILFPLKAIALDFVNGNQLNPLVSKGYKVQSNDTFGGYSIFAPDGDWIVSSTSIGQTTGGTRALNQPFLGMQRYQNGKWVMGQIITLTIEQDGGMGGWKDDPCAGEKIVKINFVRGSLDRCAVAVIKPISIGGVQTNTLEILFIESNMGGRFYQSTFNIHYENLGLTYSAVTDKSSEFNRRLKEWMEKFLDATIKAAGYNKPVDAFKDVPTFTNAINNITKTPTVPLTPSTQQGVANTPSKNIQYRLQNLKDLYDKKLITEDDYDKKRKEVLNSL